MMTPGMPKKMLPHQAVCYPSGDSRNGTVYGEGIPLASVRLEWNAQYSVKGSVQTAAYKAVLYYDCQHSRPEGVIFRVRDKIVFGEAELFVTSISAPASAGGNIHHYELGLV